MNKNKYKIAVIGAGNGGQAIAGHLSLMGHTIRLYARDISKLARIVERGGIQLTGEVNGFGLVKTITSNLKEAIQDADVIMVCTTADAHKDIAYKLSNLINEKQIIVLNPGRTCGAMEFRRILDQNNTSSDVKIVEVQSLIYACRLEMPGSVRIIGFKDNVYYSTFPKKDLDGVDSVMQNIYTSFKKVDNVLITSFENFGALFHSVIVLFNVSKIERGEDFYFYNDITPHVCRLLEKVDRERILLGQKYGVKVKSAEEWISFAYTGISGTDFFSKMKNNPAYFKIMAPKSLHTRLLLEDIPTGILPMIELGKIVGLELPLMNSIYHLASNLLDIDFRKEGRTLENLGLENISVEKLLKLL